MSSQAVIAGLEMEKLPSLPHILVKMLEVCHDDNADFQQISRIVAQDAAITGRVLALANSPLYSSASSVNTLERALLVLGTDTLKTLIITVAVQQFFSNFGKQHSRYLKQFWRQSLTCALLSKSFAALTNYAYPEQAYLAGLLHNVGSLVLQSQFPERYQSMLDAAGDKPDIVAIETLEFGVNHCDLGAELLASWGLDKFTCDSVLYHHESDADVRDAHHLVKLVSLSAVLSEREAIGDSASFQSADALFGLTVPLTREIVLQIETEVGRVAQSMGIELDVASDGRQDRKAMQALADQIKTIGLLQNAKEALLQSGSREELNTHIIETVKLLFNVSAAFLFDINASGEALVLQLETEHGGADFKIPLMAGRSLIVDAALQQKVGDSFASPDKIEKPLAVVDRQIVGLGARKGIVAVPMVHAKTTACVLVLGLDETYPPEKQQLLSLFAAEAAKAIIQCESRGDDSESAALKEGIENRLKEIAHEANNPLSIIRNYLELLAMKLGDEHAAHNELSIIREEIDRSGQIILQL
jgi:HD-like signal output (HDOD) protein